VVKKPDVKLFCPRTMVRYDDTPNEYKTIFVCKMCLTCVLSEDAVKPHIMRCNEANKKVIPVKNDEESRYICEFCNRVFSRKVALKKHKEQHETATDLESDDEFVFPLPRKLIRTSSDGHVGVQYSVNEGAAVERVEGKDSTYEDFVVGTDAQSDVIAIEDDSVAMFKDVAGSFKDEIAAETAVAVAEDEAVSAVTDSEIEAAAAVAEAAVAAAIIEVESEAAAAMNEAAAAAMNEAAAAAATLEGLI